MNLSLPTGTLELDISDSAWPIDQVLGFAARDNAKRGFLFLSKVLGKHWPVTPSLMREVHENLAAGVPAPHGPVVFIAMAETAIGLGRACSRHGCAPTRPKRHCSSTPPATGWAIPN